MPDERVNLRLLARQQRQILSDLAASTSGPAAISSAAIACCSSRGDRRPSPVLPGRERPTLIQEAFRLEWLTVGWMVIEAVVAIGSGVVAGSIVLLAFGLDSVIELISAGVLIWRLSVELERGREFSERAERLASRIGGGLLFALAAYIVLSAVWSFWARQGAEFSVAGLVVTALAIPIMRYLARRKIKLAEQLSSRAMRSDAMESITCGWLSLVVMISLAAQAALGTWWVDPVGSLAMVWLLFKEGREAWVGDVCRCS